MIGWYSSIFLEDYPGHLENLSNSEVKIYKGMHVVTFHPLQSNMRDEVNTNCVSAIFPRDKNWKANLLAIDSNNLTSWQNMEVLQLLEELKDVFSQSSTDYGRITLIEHRIDTDEARPIH